MSVPADAAPSLTDIPREKFPRHIAIIMDGNGRWAVRRGLERVRGHQQGAVTVRNVEPSLQGQTAGIGGQRLRVGGTDGEIAAWLRRVEDAGKTDYQTIERKGAEPLQINHTGEKPLLFGRGGGAASVLCAW